MSQRILLANVATALALGPGTENARVIERVCVLMSGEKSHLDVSKSFEWRVGREEMMPDPKDVEDYR